MAKMFDKIGKAAKDLLGKGMDTDKKFTFSKEALSGLVRPRGRAPIPRLPLYHTTTLRSECGGCCSSRLHCSAPPVGEFTERHRWFGVRELGTCSHFNHHLIQLSIVKFLS